MWMAVINKNSLFQGLAKEIINRKVRMKDVFHCFMHTVKVENVVWKSERNSSFCSSFERLLIEIEGDAVYVHI
jgi:hypothetical protein